MWLAIGRRVTQTRVMRAPSKPLPLIEFVILASLMISVVALSTDMMLPALDVIGYDLGVAHINDAQLVISSLFLGFAAGQLISPVAPPRRQLREQVEDPISSPVAGARGYVQVLGDSERRKHLPLLRHITDAQAAASVGAPI